MINKKVLFVLGLLLLSISGITQNTQDDFHPGDKDYKDPEQFERFWRRRFIISTWQVHSLKKGALVVKLKSNSIVVDALKKRGDVRMAEKKRLEAKAMNLNICRAFRNLYKFSKIYFIYSNYSDSLQKGVRNNIFLDSNLVIDPNINMTEDFYLLAENDFIYNSSIGFVQEDSAAIVKEGGSMNGAEATIVIKNKYGHQLKKPFPYVYYSSIGTVFFRKRIYEENIYIEGKYITFNVVRNPKNNGSVPYMFHGKPMKLILQVDFAYENFSNYVYALNDNLFQFYQASTKPSSAELESVKPYLY